MCRIVGLAVVVVVLGWGQVAQATTITSVDVVLQVFDFPGPAIPVIFGTGPLVGDVAQQTMNSNATGAISTASATFFVDNGSLHASVDAFGSLVGGFNAGTGQAGAQLYFEDSITLKSATLAAGTVVDYEVTLNLSYSSTGGCVTPPSWGLGVFAASMGGTLVPSGFNVSDSTCDLQDNFGATAGVFSGIIGQEYTVWNLLNVSASGFGGQSAGVNALNTSSFSIDPLGDFTYESASGNTYFSNGQSTTVPEPSTLLLISMGLAGLVVLRKRSA